MYTSQSDTNKLYDLTTIYAISDSNPEFLKKLLKVFADNISADLELMKSAAEHYDWTEVSQIAHKMKPSLNHFGINCLQQPILTLEHPFKFDSQQFAMLVAEVDRVLNEVLEELKNEFPGVIC